MLLLHPSLQVTQVICGYRVNVELESTAVHHFPLEALVPANLVYIGKMMLAAVRCQYGLVNIVLYLCHQAVLVALAPCMGVDTGVVVFLYQGLQPFAIYATMVFPDNEACDVLYLLVKLHAFLVRDECHTGFVALFLRTPVVGADGELACRLDIYASLVTQAEIHPCEVGDVVLRCGLPYKCGHFHSLYACLVYHFNELALHVIVNVAVSDKGTASLHMPGHGCNQIWIGYLLVEVADKSLPCRMARCHLI